MGIYTIRLNFNILMKNCSYMFFNCKSITSIDLSLFNTSEVVDMAYMFSGCINLYSINLTSFNTSRVKGMSNMFSECRNLNSIDLSSFDTKNVNSMSYMFSNCKNLKFIDLSSLDSSNLINNSYMLVGCGNLEKVKSKKNFISKDIDSLCLNNDLNLKKNYYLINSIRYKFEPSLDLSTYSKTLQKELNFAIFDLGFQIFSFIDKTLIGVMEGPAFSLYQNGFFLFKIIYPIDFPIAPS